MTKLEIKFVVGNEKRMTFGHLALSISPKKIKDVENIFVTVVSDINLIFYNYMDFLQWSSH